MTPPRPPHPDDPNQVPRPLPSPEPLIDDVSDTPTGRYRALKKEFKLDRVFTISTAILALLVSLGSVFAGYRTLLGEARAQAKGEVEKVVPRVVAVEQGQAAVMVELRETRQDIKELYKSQRFDRPSPRLEKPLPALDGGRP